MYRPNGQIVVSPSNTTSQVSVTFLATPAASTNITNVVVKTVPIFSAMNYTISPSLPSSGNVTVVVTGTVPAGFTGSDIVQVCYL